MKADFLKNYLAFLSVKKGLRPNSLEAYRKDIQNYLDFLKEKKRRPEEPGIAGPMALFMVHLHNKNLSPRTIARKSSALHGFYRYLVRRRKISKDPTKLLERPKVGRSLPKVLSIKEIENILEQPYPSDPLGLRDKAILEILYATGIRESELINLEMRNINRKAESLIIVGKGGRKRLVPIGKHALSALDAYLLKGRRKLLKQIIERQIFLNNHGKPLSRMGVWKITNKYARSAGIVRMVSPQIFRHSCAIQMLESGASIHAIQERLGHVCSSTTQIYTHLTS
jgi:integrase/recombinase XerD